MIGLASLTTEIRVDFPTFGKPSRPTSARSLSSRLISHSSPGMPSLANLGVWRVGVAKCTFPKPPLPPCAATNSSVPDISAMILPVVTSLMTVPFGTSIIRSSPFFPLQREPRPSAPFFAQYFFLYLKSARVERLVLTRNMMFPPLPPSPPSGPPEATYFSR